MEISGHLAKTQEELLVLQHPCVSITHKSIFHWDRREPVPCEVSKLARKGAVKGFGLEEEVEDNSGGMREPSFTIDN
jgi:hypothetical protein